MNQPHTYLTWAKDCLTKSRKKKSSKAEIKRLDIELLNVTLFIALS